MNILLAAEWIDLSVFEGGSQHHCYYTEALADLGHEVHLLARNTESNVFQGRLKKVYLHSAPNISFRPNLSKASMPLIEKICKDYKIDVIHKRMDPGSGYSLKIAKKLGIPLIAEVNYNPFSFERRHKFFRDVVNPLIQVPLRHIWARRTLEKASIITCVSNSIKETLIRHGIKNRIEVIPNGADIKKFNPNSNGKIIKEKYKLKWPTLFLIGGLGPRHGLENIIEAAKILEKTKPEATFLLIGGIQKYKDFIDQLKKKAGSNVIFTGKVSDEEITSYFAACDIALAPFEESINPKEPFGFSPIKILEYMASGKPIISSDLPWIRELIEPGLQGLLIDLNKPNELADAILKLANDKILMEKMIINSRRKAEELSWENIAKRYVSVYNNLLNKGL